MSVTIEHLEGLQRRVPLQISSAALGSEVQTRLRNLSKTVKMQGFRPGKVPMKMVESNYGPQLHAEVLSDMVSKQFQGAIEAGKLRIAGQPRIDRAAGDKAVEGDNLNFEAVFEVYPELSLGDTTGLSIERFTCAVADAEVERTVDVLRKQRVSWSAAERVAQDGDRVTLDFLGKVDGVAFQGGEAKAYPFVLGEGRMIPEFEVAVRGMKAGDSKTAPVNFPAEYNNQELAGKAATFDLSVSLIEAPLLPPVDAEFAKQLGVPDGDVAKMRSDIRNNLEREVASRLRARTKNSAMDQLPALAEFSLPSALVSDEQGRLAEMAKADLQQRGVDVKNMPIPVEAFKENAEKRVRLGLIVGELVKKENLVAKPDQIRKQIDEFAQSYENPGEVIRWYYSDRQRLAEVEAMVVEQNVVDHLLAKAKVSDKAISFEELMGQN
jgi:trigger factor